MAQQFMPDEIYDQADAMTKHIHVAVSEETYALIVHAVELSPFDFADWMRHWCLEAARAEIRANLDANRAAMEAAP